MRYLLDTHAFLWWVANDAQLSERVKTIVKDPENDIMVSSASVWEMAVKAGLERLRIPGELSQFIPEQIASNGFAILPINVPHALQVYKLPLLLRDPFDRMLVAQAVVENLPLITKDPALSRYEIPVIW